MKSKSAAGLYLLLTVFAAISMAYYITGVLALRQEFFHSSRYVREPQYRHHPPSHLAQQS